MGKSDDYSVAVGSVNGEEVHAVLIDRPEYVKNHPHVEAVHAALQAAITSRPSPGVQATVGITKGDAIEAMKAAGPEGLADRIRDIVLSQWIQNALTEKRIEPVSYQETLDDTEFAITRIGAVVFTDAQFSQLMVAIEEQFLHAVDKIIEQTLDAEHEVKSALERAIGKSQAPGSGGSIETSEQEARPLDAPDIGDF